MGGKILDYEAEDLVEDVSVVEDIIQEIKG